MSPQQRDLYTTFQKGLKISEEEILEEFECMRSVGNGRNKADVQNSERLHPYKALLYLSLLSVHPALIISQSHRAYRDRLLRDRRCSGKMLELVRVLVERAVVSPTEYDGNTLWGDLIGEEQGVVERHVMDESEEGTSDGDHDIGKRGGDRGGRRKRRRSGGRGSAVRKVAKRRVGEVLSGTDRAKSVGVPGDAAETGVQRKCLIFARHRSALDMVESCVFQRYFPSVPYARLDGLTPPLKRADVARAFNENSQLADSPRVLLLTTSSCGLGLGLTAADTVIFLEHSWNPFEDLQAADRAHRLGQTKSVTVIRLLGKRHTRITIHYIMQYNIFPYS